MKINRRQALKATALPIAYVAVESSASAQTVRSTETVAPPYGLPISSEFPYQKKKVSVQGSNMAYVDEGDGPAVLFLHGNPTSSYLWRNIIPHMLMSGYRAIAPDLMCMGDSDKPDITYTFDEHAEYLDSFIVSLGLKDITLVIHDWGSALGMRYARLNPANVRALSFMEAIFPPGMPSPPYEAMGPIGDIFKNLRTQGIGEEMVLNKNFFVEEVLSKMGVARPLTTAEMTHYRAPYPTPQSRLPTLQWPREIPIAGEPKATFDAITANGQWLGQSRLPKLYFYASPGALNPEPVVQWLIANVPNMESRFLGKGVHYLQEDHPDLIGTGLVDWLRRI